MIITNLIKSLHGAGVSLEAIIIAVETLEAELDAKRLAATERQRVSRLRRHNTSRDVTPTPPQVSPLGYNPPSYPTPSEPNGSVSETSSDVQPVGKKGRKRNAYPPDFEDFWQGFPTDANMSKSECFSEWKKLSAEDRIDARASITGFLSYCKDNPDYRPIHGNRYLKYRRFEGHLAKSKEAAQWQDVRQGDPNWDAWLAFYRDGGRKFMVKMMTEKAEKGEAFRVPNQWPETVKGQAA